MSKHFKQIKRLDCVQEGGLRHFVAHLLGIERISYCWALIGRRMTGSFAEGILSKLADKAER